MKSQDKNLIENFCVNSGLEVRRIIMRQYWVCYKLLNYVMSSLCRRHDSVIIMSIHQPRYSIFKLFDRLTLLSLGNMVYHGEPLHALHYFGELGKRSIWVHIT